jgi:hypothetical protein
VETYLSILFFVGTFEGRIWNWLLSIVERKESIIYTIVVGHSFGATLNAM